MPKEIQLSGNLWVINEGETLEFTVIVVDPDLDVLTYSANNIPLGAIFNPITQFFTWTPTFEQEGNYSDIEFAVTDNGDPILLDTDYPVLEESWDINQAKICVCSSRYRVRVGD